MTEYRGKCADGPLKGQMWTHTALALEVTHDLTKPDTAKIPPGSPVEPGWYDWNETDSTWKWRE